MTGHAKAVVSHVSNTGRHGAPQVFRGLYWITG